MKITKSQASDDKFLERGISMSYVELNDLTKTSSHETRSSLKIAQKMFEHFQIVTTIIS